MKLTDKAILRMVSESPGRNTSKPIGGPDQKIDPRGRVFSCRTKATYALGRRVEYYDMPAVRAIALEAAHNGNRMSSFIFGIVNSAAFQMKKSENTEPTTVVGESGPP